MITVTLKWANKILKTILEPAPGGGDVFFDFVKA